MPDFRETFYGVLEKIEQSKGIGYALFFANAYPLHVKEPYRFLLDPSVPDDEKITIVTAAASIAGGTKALLHYIFDADALRRTVTPDSWQQTVKECVATISARFEEARSLLAEAEHKGTPVENERARFDRLYDDFGTTKAWLDSLPVSGNKTPDFLQ